MSRFEIRAYERGKPVLNAKAEEIGTCKDKFEHRFNEKYGGKKDVSKNKV
jgi:hypothetical protein